MMQRCVLLIALAVLPAQTQPSLPRRTSRIELLPGLWSADTTFGPAARGLLTVEQADTMWRASVAGLSSTFRVVHDSVRFTLAGDQGQFRGALTADRRVISGFWVQPTGVVLGQPLASPLTLLRSRARRWSGVIAPLPDRFTLSLSVTRDSSGVLSGVFRNPQLNSRGGAARYQVVLNGDSVLFLAGPGPSQASIRLAAVFDPAHGELRLAWPGIARNLTLTRAGPGEAAGFLPRPADAAPYRYRPPPSEPDGWRTARAASVGLDELVLQRLVRSVADTDPAAPRAPLIHSLLIARHGRLVLEEYFYGYNRDEPHDLRSASKTFASVMVGAAEARGDPISPATPVYALLASEGPFANPDPRKAQITVGELMTHTSGLACDDNDDASPGNEDTMQGQQAQPDWWKYTLDLPVAHDPGTHYAYCSAGMNLVGAALTAATGTWLPALFDRLVARPLGFARYYFNLMPTGEGYAGGGLHLRPRDLLKLGQAYLDGGRWNGRRLVPAAWVAASTRLQSDSTGATDGFAWHLNLLHSGARTLREYEANGNGGQFLIVVPQLDLAVVFTAGNYNQYPIWRWFRDRLVADDIIPAIREPALGHLRGQ